MKSIQNATLNRIEKTATKFKLFSYSAFGFPNVGTVYITDNRLGSVEGDFVDVLLMVDFNFQAKYGSFKIINNVNKKEQKLLLVRYENLRELFNPLEKELRALKGGQNGT